VEQGAWAEDAGSAGEAAAGGGEGVEDQALAGPWGIEEIVAGEELDGAGAAAGVAAGERDRGGGSVAEIEQGVAYLSAGVDLGAEGAGFE
jgi:hypothetical protein